MTNLLFRWRVRDNSLSNLIARAGLTAFPGASSKSNAMKIIKKIDGSLNVRATILSLEPGQSWTVKESNVNAEYVRGVASKLGRVTGRTFSVANSREDRGRVIVTRVNNEV